MKKVLSLLLVFVIILSACSGDSSSADEEGFKMLITSEDAEGNPMKQAVEAYEEETGIAIEIVEVPSGDYATKLQSMISAGDTPAVAKGTNWITFSDYVLPIDDLITSDDIDKSMLGLSQDPDSGEIKAIPVNMTGVGLIANKDILDAAGIEVPANDDPWTWDEFNDIIADLADEDEVRFPIVFDKSSQRLTTIIKEFGGLPYSVDGDAVTLDSPESVEAMQNFVDLFDAGYSPESTWVGAEDPQSMFKTGEIAFHFAGNWVYPDYLESTNFEFVSIPLPVDEVRSTTVGGNYVYALDTDKNDQATAFLEWFLQPEVYADYAAAGDYIPGLTITDITYETEHLQEFMDTFIADIQSSDADAIVNGTNLVNIAQTDTGGILRDNIELAIKGDITVEEAISNTAEDFSEAYDLPQE